MYNCIIRLTDGDGVLQTDRGKNYHEGGLSVFISYIIVVSQRFQTYQQVYTPPSADALPDHSMAFLNVDHLQFQMTS
jgi:hypothetical protein